MTSNISDDDINLIFTTDAASESPRRMYTINEFVYDTKVRKFWCLVDGWTRSANAVDAMVSMRAWPLDADGKRCRPSQWIKREAVAR